MSNQPEAERGDPLHVWYVGQVVLTTMALACMEFTIRRYASGLIVECPNGTTWDLNRFIRLRGCRDYSGNEEKPVPAELVWDRLLEIAEMRDEGVSTGRIGFELRGQYPYTDWTARVGRKEPDRLTFELTLDRVDTSLPTNDRE